MRLEAYARPEIKQEYERRMGAFLVRFNNLELGLGMVLTAILKGLDKEALGEKMPGTHMADKVTYLSLLQLVPEAAAVIGKVNIERLTELTRMRNEFAHGHFHQNIMDGSFRIIAANKKGNDKAPQFRAEGPEDAIQREYARIDAATKMCAEADNQLMNDFIWSDFAKMFEPDEIE